MSNKKSNRVPTEQQKYRIFKNITEPALLEKNKPEEVSDIVKAIKEALGVKPPPVGNTTTITEVFGNEDEALQQKVKREAKAIENKIQKENKLKIDQELEGIFDTEKKSNASSKITANIKRHLNNTAWKKIYPEVQEFSENSRVIQKSAKRAIARKDHIEGTSARKLQSVVKAKLDKQYYDDVKGLIDYQNKTLQGKINSSLQNLSYGTKNQTRADIYKNVVNDVVEKVKRGNPEKDAIKLAMGQTLSKVVKIAKSDKRTAGGKFDKRTANTGRPKKKYNPL